jgi:hypothetical protein
MVPPYGKITAYSLLSGGHTHHSALKNQIVSNCQSSFFLSCFGHYLLDLDDLVRVEGTKVDAGFTKRVANSG